MRDKIFNLYIYFERIRIKVFLIALIWISNLQKLSHVYKQWSGKYDLSDVSLVDLSDALDEKVDLAAERVKSKPDASIIQKELAML